MWPYWMFLAIPAVGVFSPLRLTHSGRFCMLLAVTIFFAAVIGLRHEVGGDWQTYLEHQRQIEELPLSAALAFGDPGYYLINWVSGQLGGGIYMTNSVCAVLLMAGTLCLALRQPHPWISLFVAVPYLIIVVAMGYTRQSAALGLAMIGLAALDRGRVLPFVGWIILAAFFHRTAVILLPIAGLAVTRRRFWSMLWIGVIAALAATQFLLGELSSLWELYVTSNMQSDGGLIRLAMNAIPALLFLAFRRHMGFAQQSQQLWFWMSIMALCCIGLVAFSSTLADRIALYFLPLQLVVFSRAFLVFQSGQLRAAFALGTLMYYTLVQFVWLTMANHAPFWLPYQMMPL